MGEDAFQADGDGMYDIWFDFPTANNDNRFKDGEELVWIITGNGITANSFDYLSAPGGGYGPFQSVAHVPSILGEENNSQWIAAVPIPATVWIFGARLIGLVGVRRKLRAS